MAKILGIPIAIACALGMGAASAQTVLRDGAVVGDAAKAPQTVAQAATSAPIQVAQARGSSGGASAGASTGGTATGVGLGTALIVVGAAVAAIAVTVDNGSTSSH